MNFSTGYYTIPQMTWMRNSYFTIFIAEEYTGPNQRAGILSGTDANAMFIRLNYTTSVAFQLFSASDENSVVFTAPTSQTRIWSFTYTTADTRSIFVNGSVVQQLALSSNLGATTFLTGVTPSYIGTDGWNIASETYSGKIREILCYQGNMTQANRKIIEGYLAWKWAVNTNLPNTHPYYSSPPISPVNPWTPILTGTRIQGGSYVPSGSLLTNVILNTTGGTAMYQIGPIRTTATSKLLIAASLSMIATSANAVQMTVGRATTSGSPYTGLTNVVSNTSGIPLPISDTQPAYFMAAATTISGQAANLSATVVDTPGAGTFYYTIFASSLPSMSANSSITANLNVVQM